MERKPYPSTYKRSRQRYNDRYDRPSRQPTWKRNLLRDLSNDQKQSPSSCETIHTPIKTYSTKKEGFVVQRERSRSPTHERNGFGGSLSSSPAASSELDSANKQSNSFFNKSWVELSNEDDEDFIWEKLSENFEIKAIVKGGAEVKTVSEAKENVTSEFKEPLPMPDISAVKEAKSEGDILCDSSSDIGSKSDDRVAMSSPSRPQKRKNEFEMDANVLLRRQKQIDFGKNTIGYQNYLKAVPKFKRCKTDMGTPNKYLKYSRRSWDQQVKIWRRFLHRYDAPEGENAVEEEEMDEEMLTMMSEIFGVNVPASVANESTKTQSVCEMSGKSSPVKNFEFSEEDFPMLPSSELDSLQADSTSVLKSC